MKIFSVLLGVSLAANAILLAAFLRHPGEPNHDGDSGSPKGKALSRSAAAVSLGSAIATKANPNAVAANAALISASTRLNPDDLVGILAWLRSSGFPPRATAPIMSQLVGRHFQSRQEALNLPNLDQPFWKNPPAAFDDPKIAAQRLSLQREQMELLKRLFGDKMMDIYSDSEEARVSLRREVGDLPPEKLSGIANIVRDYSLMAQELRANSRGGAPSPADAEKLALLEKERRADIAKLLTPEELLDFQMHYSPTSSRMRRDLGLFKPSEDEYRVLFPILDSVEQQFPSALGATADMLAARRAAEEKLQGQIVAALGPERYEEFKQSTDPANAQLNRLVARLDLHLNAARQVTTIRTEIQQRVADLRQNQELSPEGRNAQLAALAEEASSRIAAVMGGTRGLDAYKEYGGQWLGSLMPRPTVPVARDPRN